MSIVGAISAATEETSVKADGTVLVEWRVRVPCITLQ